MTSELCCFFFEINFILSRCDDCGDCDEEICHKPFSGIAIPICVLKNSISTDGGGASNESHSSAISDKMC